MRKWVVFALILSVLACSQDGEKRAALKLKSTILAKEKIAVERKQSNLTLHWAAVKAERSK